MSGEGVLNVGANTQNVGNLWKSHLFNTPHMDIKWVERLMGWNHTHTHTHTHTHPHTRTEIVL